MKYTDAIAWIAKHEPHAEHDPTMLPGDPLEATIVAAYYTTVHMTADLFGVDVGIVAQDVCAEHKRQSIRPLRSVADIRRGRPT